MKVMKTYKTANQKHSTSELVKPIRLCGSQNQLTKILLRKGSWGSQLLAYNG